MEFALVAPLLLTLLLGIMEFGLMFGQKLDITNGAREGARLVSVNHQTTAGSNGAAQTTEIVTETCARMALAVNTTITITFPGGTEIGDTVEFEITAAYSPVTGLFDPMLYGSTLASAVVIRLEQPATFSAVTGESCP